MLLLLITFMMALIILGLTMTVEKPKESFAQFDKAYNPPLYFMTSRCAGGFKNCPDPILQGRPYQFNYTSAINELDSPCSCPSP